MHPFTSGSSIVTLTRHPSDGSPSENIVGRAVSPGSAGNTTLAFTDADGNVITSVVDAISNSSPTGVTIVSSESIVGSHFLSADAVPKLEMDDDVSSMPPIEVMVKPNTKKANQSESEKKVCLWPTGNGTTCGKTFAKFDSLKRHLAEAHKGVRPFACSLCDKTYGRRDYLQRHLKSHNANYAVNLASASSISAAQVVQTVNKVEVNPKNTIILSQGQGGSLQVVQPAVATSNQIGINSSLPFFNLPNQQPKPLGSKICRWVQNDGTVCGKAFSKLDSLRRHVNELHKGVRPFACTFCEKNYGRRDYLDRHLRTHDPDNRKRKAATLDWDGSGVLLTEDGEPIKKVVKKKRKDIPAEEKKICLWVLEDGTACGKTFTKFDSLKRHVTEAHKGVRPFACSLCGKNYGRRDYLLRHLRSHNEAEVASISTTRIISSSNQVLGHVVGTSGSNALGEPAAALVSPPTLSASTVPAIRINANKKRLNDKKTCRWVLDNGTICGRSFSKFDSLRRHVQELHKGVRPFVCHLCEKSYGRRDYLDRHMRSHANPGSLDASGSSDDANPDEIIGQHLSGNDDATLNEVVTVVSADDELAV